MHPQSGRVLPMLPEGYLSMSPQLFAVVCYHPHSLSLPSPNSLSLIPSLSLYHPLPSLSLSHNPALSPYQLSCQTTSWEALMAVRKLAAVLLKHLKC